MPGIPGALTYCGSTSTCKASCSATETPGAACVGGICCAPKAAAATPANMTTTGLSNPLSFSTVDGLLAKVLSFLQSVIVLLTLIFIVLGAFFYITSAGDSGRIETAKKFVFYALVGLAIGIAAPAFLRQIYDILGAGPTTTVSGTTLTVIAIARNILNFLLSIVGVVAIIMLIVGAFMYLTAAGDEDRIDTGKKIAKYSVIGIAIALAALVLVRQVGSFF